MSPATRVAQGQSSIDTVAPKTAAINALQTPIQNQAPQVTTTSVLPTITTLVGDENGKPPAAPAVGAGEAEGIINGENVSAIVTRSNNQVTAKVGGITATLSGLLPNGERIELDADGNLRLEEDAKIVIESTGYEAEQNVEVWMFSTPSLLGKLSATETGAISGTFDIPSDLQSGDHRLVLKGMNKDGEDVVLGVGMMFGSADSGTSVASRVRIGVPVALAVLFGLLIPAVSRRRRKQSGIA
ncbi:MAG: hypothetical protein O3B90_09410 [Actinomycetota bacterium]|nr:hypothetical protein [Actinomycetota bacterium]